MSVLALVQVCLVWAAAPAVFPFDGSAISAEGHEPVLAAGLAYAEGRDGDCLFVGRGARLTYPTDGLYDPAAGSVSVWVRPRWRVEELRGDRVLWSVAGDPGQDNEIALGFYGDAGRQIVYFSNPAGRDGAIAPLTWSPGEWHLVTACWEESLHCRGLYIDGRLAALAHYSAPMPVTQDAFEVGSLGGPAAYEAECDLDDLRLEGASAAPGFVEAAREALGGWEARQRAEQETRRLLERFSLEGVAREHIEVTWEDLDGPGVPITKRVPIEARHHPDIVFVQPDLSIALGNDDAALGFGLALGAARRMPRVGEPTLRLKDGYLPIVESEWRVDSLVLRETAFCVLPADDEVTTGREPQYLRVRLTLTNEGTAPAESEAALLIGRMHGSQNVNYGPFLAPETRWQQTGLDLRADEPVVLLGGRALLAYRAEEGVRAVLDDALCLSATLAPGGTRSVDLVMPTGRGLCSPEELTAAAAAPYEAALSRAVEYWKRPLARGMKLTTPEPRLNDIYRHIVLSALASTKKEPDRPWEAPYQNLFAQPMVWPWEFASMAAPLASVGYAEELRPSLRFFTERQNGVGPYADGRGPDGDVLTTEGCYTGTSMYWMCETGAVLWALAENALYAGDREWLREQRPGILAAWEFLQRERARTRLRYDDGRKVEYYGLLPKGRVHDWEGRRHHFGFSDGYTWQGMSRMAEAFRVAGLPEADRLTREADEYGRCILEVARRSQFADPETGLTLIPNTVFYREGVRGGLWWTDGPLALFAVGLLRPEDPYFGSMVEYLERTSGTRMGLLNHMEGPPDNPFWYLNITERTYYRDFLARGEFEKALLVFTATFVYGLSHDCYQTVERVNLDDGNYAPFQPNPSGNGRMVEMLKRMVVDEQDPRTLWLLRGCPSRWFAAGQTIEARDAPTLFGTVAVRSRAREGEIVLGVTPPAQWPPDGLRVVVRDPERRPFRQVTVNGRPARMEGETLHLTEPAKAFRIVCTR